MFKLKRLCELCCIVIGTALFVDILCSISFSFRFFFFEGGGLGYHTWLWCDSLSLTVNLGRFYRPNIINKMEGLSDLRCGIRL